MGGSVCRQRLAVCFRLPTPCHAPFLLCSVAIVGARAQPQAGGFVVWGRVNANLNISRALGDATFKQVGRGRAHMRVQYHFTKRELKPPAK